MKNSRMKMISKIMIFIMIFSMTMGMTSSVMGAAQRLTSARDTLSRTQASGTGAPTQGYTQSTQSITDDFVIVSGANDTLCMNTTTATTFTSSCTATGNVKVNLITHGGLTSGSHYTGDQIATAIATGLAAQDGDADDSYTVTYAESSDLFSVRADGGNSLNPSLGWASYTDPDKAAVVLGYTADDTYIRDTVAISDNAVAFNVRTGYNDTFSISVDQYAAVSVTIAQAVYTAEGLRAEMDTKIDAPLSIPNVTVSYANDKFKITSDDFGAESAIVVIEDVTKDFLRSVRLVGDVPVDGMEMGGIVSADHTIVFTLASAVQATDKIVIIFPPAPSFGLTGINFEDVDMAGSSTGEIALGSAPSGTTWGAVVSGQTLTLTSDTGTLSAETITIEIGRHALAGTPPGTEQISNPTAVGLHQITIEQQTSGGVVEQDARIAVYIVPDDSVVIQATVDPILSFAIQGGTVLDFGTLEPNAYHKLGGARSAYGTITLTNVTIDAVMDTNTVTVRGIVYEFSDDGVANGTNTPVMIVDNENNYLTEAQVTSNLYRAINNTDGALVRANIDHTTHTVVRVVIIAPGIAGNAYTITENVTHANFAVTTFANGVAGYNNKATSIAYATGSDVGNSQTGTNLVISTNSAGGYVISVRNTDDGTEASGLTNGTTNIDKWGTGAYGYGLLASAQSARYGNGTAGIIADAFEGDGTGDLPEEMTTTAAPLASYAGTAANDNIAVEYNVRIDAAQPAGAYSDTVTYIATATY